MAKEKFQQTTQQRVEALRVSQLTMLWRLRAIGFVPKPSKWVPHQLEEAQRQRLFEATSILSFRRTKTWLSSIVTGEEKRVLSKNIQGKRSWCAVAYTRNRKPPLVSIWKRSCYQSRGTARACFCLNSCHPIFASMCSCDANNWIFQLVRFNASARGGPSAYFTAAPGTTSQTSPAIGCLTWAEKCSSTRCMALTLGPPTFVCTYHWATTCDTIPCQTKMIWASGCGISFAPKPKTVYRDCIQHPPEKGRNWLVETVITMVVIILLYPIKFLVSLKPFRAAKIFQPAEH